MKVTLSPFLTVIVAGINEKLMIETVFGSEAAGTAPGLAEAVGAWTGCVGVAIRMLSGACAGRDWYQTTPATTTIRMIMIGRVLMGDMIREEPAGAIIIINKCPVIYWEHDGIRP